MKRPHDDGMPPPRRRWGQNFLVDRSQVRRLIEHFAPAPSDRVVEIGPGRGALSELLVPEVGRYLALEIDPLLVPTLRVSLSPWPHAEVRLANALQADWPALAAECGGALRIIANLPYNVGTAIVRRLLASEGILDIQVVLQLEVVERFLSREGSKSYGPLAIIAALRSRPRRLGILAPGAFRPRPRVRSAALRLEILDDAPLPAAEVATFENWLFAGFAHRRKTLAGNLPAQRELVRNFLVAQALPADARAEAVPAATWLRLARLLQSAAAK